MRTLSVDDVSRLLGPVDGGAGTPLDTPHCVYVHVFDVPPPGKRTIALAEALSADACPLQAGSAAGRALQESLQESLIAAGDVRSLAYVGMTTSSTVQARIKLDRYEKNRLMAKTWKLTGGPSTLLGFADGLARSGPALEVVEFAIVEMLQTFGRGFNLQPGGPFTYSKRRWASLAECMAFAEEKGITTADEWRVWRKANAEERLRRGMPSEPNVIYKHSGWEGWASFFGFNTEAEVKQRNSDSTRESAQAKRAKVAGIAYEDAAFVPYVKARAFMAEKGITTERQWRAWCKANAEERVRRGMPSNPERDYKGSGWVSWASFLREDA